MGGTPMKDFSARNSMRLAQWAALLLLAWAFPSLGDSTDAPVEVGKVLKRTYDFKEAGKEMEYALFVPTRYNKKKATPLVVLLHGLTSNPQQVINYKGIVEQAEKHGFIVVAPYGYNTGGWYGSQGPGKTFRVGRTPPDSPDNLGELSEKDVLNVLDLTRNEFNIDRRRTYLMGHSMGGGGALYLGMKYPENWPRLRLWRPLSSVVRTVCRQLRKCRSSSCRAIKIIWCLWPAHDSG